jgi:hypothetical protein
MGASGELIRQDILADPIIRRLKPCHNPVTPPTLFTAKTTKLAEIFLFFLCGLRVLCGEPM